MEKDNNTFGGFSSISDLLSKPAQGSNNPDVDDPVVDPPNDDDEPIVDPSNVANLQDDDDPSKNPQPAPTQTNTTKVKVGNDTHIQSNEDDDDDQSSTVDDGFNEVEPELAAFVQEKLYEKFGWEFSEDEKKLNSFDDIVDFVDQLVATNSKPEFANPEIEKLNAYVKNGGNIERYLQSKYAGNIDLNKADLDDYVTQQMILREYFSKQGYTQDKIERRLRRYEDTGVLSDEAKDAHEILKKIREEDAQKLYIEQENNRKQQEKQQQAFFNDVVSYIDSLKDVNGVPVSQAEKERLSNFILAVGPDKKTRYQAEYEKNMIKNLVTSAYFTMAGDKFVNKLNKKAESNATLELKKKLEITTKRGKGNNARLDDTDDTQKNYDSFSRISGILSKPAF